MPAGIQGLRGTGQFTTDFRPTNYRELYTLLEPNGNAPLNALLSMASSEATDDPKFNNFRDELPDRVLKINNGAGYDSSTTSLTIDALDDNKYAITGSLVLNTATGEIMRVTTDTTATTLVVTRNVGGTSYTITDNDDLVVVGSAQAEGADTPTPISFDATVAFNYTQIFRTAFAVSGTLQQTYLRTGSKEQEAMTKALKLHMSDIERAMIWGNRHEDTSNQAQPIRYTGGIMTTVTNVIDVSTDIDGDGTMSENQFDQQLIDTIFKFGSSEKIVFCGSTIVQHLQEFGKNKWTPESVDGVYGIRFTRYKTFAGDLLVHLHPQFRQMPGMTRTMLILDLPYLSYRYMQNRDTQLLENRQGNGEDQVKHEYLTECGLEFLQDKVHTVVTNWAVNDIA